MTQTPHHLDWHPGYVADYPVAIDMRHSQAHPCWSWSSHHDWCQRFLGYYAPEIRDIGRDILRIRFRTSDDAYLWVARWNFGCLLSKFAEGWAR